MQRGRFITLEGIDGTGKSTHGTAICSRLAVRGIEPVMTREPGGTPVGEGLRRLLLVDDYTMTAETELLLMFAARAEHIETVIRPALERGQWVVSDRFTDSSYAYQGTGRRCSKPLIDTLKESICRKIQPDLTILFDSEPETARKRTAGYDQQGRFESEAPPFFASVRSAYLEMARENPLRWRVIDAGNRKMAAVREDAIRCIDEFVDNLKQPFARGRDRSAT